jgi:hypothetical protein
MIVSCIIILFSATNFAAPAPSPDTLHWVGGAALGAGGVLLAAKYAPVEFQKFIGDAAIAASESATEVPLELTKAVAAALRAEKVAFKATEAFAVRTAKEVADVAAAHEATLSRIAAGQL